MGTWTLWEILYLQWLLEPCAIMFEYLDLMDRRMCHDLRPRAASLVLRCLGASGLGNTTYPCSPVTHMLGYCFRVLTYCLCYLEPGLTCYMANWAARVVRMQLSIQNEPSENVNHLRQEISEHGLCMTNTCTPTYMCIYTPRVCMLRKWQHTAEAIIKPVFLVEEGRGIHFWASAWMPLGTCRV